MQQFAPRRLLSQTMAKAGNDVYAWRYNQVTQNVTIDIGKVHFSVSALVFLPPYLPGSLTRWQDVAYVFSNPLPTQNPLGNRPGDAELAKLMTSMWVSFINDLTPNHHQRKSSSAISNHCGIHSSMEHSHRYSNLANLQPKRTRFCIPALRSMG